MIEPEPEAGQPAGAGKLPKKGQPADTFPLVVDLTEGFKDDTIVLRLDDEEVYRASGLSTNWSAGLAGSTTLDAPAGASILTVAAPTRKLVQTVALSVTEPLFIVVAISNAELEVQTYTAPPTTYY